jgi:hypothetical protein
MATMLNVYDYLVVMAILGISILIGLYYAVEAKYGKSWKKLFSRKTADIHNESEQMENYLIGGRQMTAIP